MCAGYVSVMFVHFARGMYVLTLHDIYVQKPCVCVYALEEVCSTAAWSVSVCMRLNVQGERALWPLVLYAIPWFFKQESGVCIVIETVVH